MIVSFAHCFSAVDFLALLGAHIDLGFYLIGAKSERFSALVLLAAHLLKMDELRHVLELIDDTGERAVWPYGG